MKSLEEKLNELPPERRERILAMAEAEFAIEHERQQGLYNRYIVQKTSGKPVDPNAEYFVMRLDDGGKDPKHIAACRTGVLAYAEAIGDHLPKLAKDLKDKYGPEDWADHGAEVRLDSQENVITKLKLRGRLIAEKTELDGRIKRLREFLLGQDLSYGVGSELDRLLRQYTIMLQYSQVLEERIDALPKSISDEEQRD